MGRKGECEKGRKKIKVKRIKTKVFYIFAVHRKLPGWQGRALMKHPAGVSSEQPDRRGGQFRHPNVKQSSL
jgi:hypothetical protein